MGIDQPLQAGQYDLWRKRQGGRHGRGGQGAVIKIMGAPGRIAPEPAEPQPLKLSKIAGTITGRQSPEVGAIAAPTAWIGGRIDLLGHDRPPAVLEIVELQLAHEGILDPAKIDPEMAVLVAEHRTEGQVGNGRGPPAAPIVLCPGRPGRWGHGSIVGAQRQDIKDHRLVIAAPFIGDEAGLRGPAKRNPARWRGRPGPVHGIIKCARQSP